MSELAPRFEEVPQLVEKTQVKTEVYPLSEKYRADAKAAFKRLRIQFRKGEKIALVTPVDIVLNNILQSVLAEKGIPKDGKPEEIINKCLNPPDPETEIASDQNIDDVSDPEEIIFTKQIEDGIPDPDEIVPSEQIVVETEEQKNAKKLTLNEKRFIKYGSLLALTELEIDYMNNAKLIKPA